MPGLRGDLETLSGGLQRRREQRGTVDVLAGGAGDPLRERDQRLMGGGRERLAPTIDDQRRPARALLGRDHHARGGLLGADGEGDDDLGVSGLLAEHRDPDQHESVEEAHPGPRQPYEQLRVALRPDGVRARLDGPAGGREE